MAKWMQPSRRNLLTLLGSAAAGSLLPGTAAAGSEAAAEFDAVPYTVSMDGWPALLGNHRVQIAVEQPADAVYVSVPWRRIDRQPETKALLLFDPDGVAVANLVPGSVAMERGELVFEAKRAGVYLLYYLPHATQRSAPKTANPRGQYLAPEMTADRVWEKRHAARSMWQQLPNARVLTFEARSQLDSFYPMEVAATKAEVEALCGRHVQPLLLFLEDRVHPIRMTDMLPRHWAQAGPPTKFAASAFRGESLVFQVGLYANPAQLKAETPLSLRFDSLAADNMTIPASAFTCINTSGVDERGRAFTREVTAKPGVVQALWCVLDVPVDAKPGKYVGAVHVSLRESAEQSVRLEFDVRREFLRDGGVDQPWRTSRIKWLNSTIGGEEVVTAPYTPLVIRQRTVSCLGREVVFGESGLPASIRAGGTEILAGPVAFRVAGSDGRWTGTSRVVSSDAASVVLSSETRGDGFDLAVQTTMQFDGGMGFEVTITSERTRSVSDIALEIPYRKDIAAYAVGMQLPGGKCPRAWAWKWSSQPERWKEQGNNLEFFCWVGHAHAGLFCRLKSPFDDWKNGDSGGVTIAEVGGTVVLRASTGPKTVKAGEAMRFSFRLLSTPVKPMAADHWAQRYVQAYLPPEELHELEATVINLHQGTEPNQFINYPFLNLDLLTPYVSTAHALGMKVKLYYTMRELTTRLPELWAFRSLGDEIYRVGGTQGQGDPQLDFWLQEHLRQHYSPGWIQKLPDGEADTSLRVYSGSRLVNFYLEGLKWLLDNVQMDGLYLDEIGYSRETMQRVRRVLQRRPGAMIDLHGNHVWWSCNCPIGYYMEHLPYVDRLWLGESFNSDGPPDYWLIEMSGIPFGLSSDMLEKPNPWRGMLFGMTDRALWSHAPSPTPIWQMWMSFGIEDATMTGWWENECPVATGREDVLATVYRKPGKALVAIASWANEKVSVRLQIDWKKLGLDAGSTTIQAPAMLGFQEAARFTASSSIPVVPGKGWLLVLEQRSI